MGLAERFSRTKVLVGMTEAPVPYARGPSTSVSMVAGRSRNCTSPAVRQIARKRGST